MGISEEELDEQCDELFKETPIVFSPRHNHQMDGMIAMYIEQLDIRIPIVPIKGSLYLIGSNRVSCSIKNDQLILRVGGGYEKFEDYVPKNHVFFQRMLVVHMIKSGESLEAVVDNLIVGKRMPNQHVGEEFGDNDKDVSPREIRGSSTQFSSGIKKSGDTPSRSPRNSQASGSMSFRGKGEARYSMTKTV